MKKRKFCRIYFAQFFCSFMQFFYNISRSICFGLKKTKKTKQNQKTNGVLKKAVYFS